MTKAFAFLALASICLQAQATQVVVRILNQFPDPISVTYAEGGARVGGQILGTLEKPHTKNFPDEATVIFNTEGGALFFVGTFGYNATTVKVTAEDIAKVAKPGQVVPICLYRTAMGMFSNSITPLVGTRDCKNSGRPDADTLLPFHSAIVNRDEEGLAKVLAATKPGAFIQEKDVNQNNVFHLAVIYGTPSIYDMLERYTPELEPRLDQMPNINGFLPRELAKRPVPPAPIFNLSVYNDFGDPLNIAIKRGVQSTKTTAGEQRSKDLGEGADIEELGIEGTGKVQGSRVTISKVEIRNCLASLSRGAPLNSMQIKLENFTAFKGSIAWVCMAGKDKEVVQGPTFSLQLRNRNDHPIYVRIVDAIIPNDQESSGFFGTIGGAFYNMTKTATRSKSLEATTPSQRIEANAEFVFQIPQNSADQFRYVYWDTNPIEEDGKGGYNLAGYFDLAPQVPQTKRTIEIATIRRVMNLAKGLVEAEATQAEIEARVEKGHPEELQLMPQEQEALRNRERKAADAIGDLIGKGKAQRIGLCMSGGGLRAMYSGLGFAIGMQQDGLLDATTYAAGLSGSTWFLMKWLKDGYKGLDGVRDDLVASMVKGLEPEEIDDPSKFEKAKRAAEQLAIGTWYPPSEKFQAQIAATEICQSGRCRRMPTYNVIDLWAYALSRRALSGEDRYNFTLSSLELPAREGRLPIPLFTAIRTESDDAYAQALDDWTRAGGRKQEQPIRDYSWFEASPFSASLLAARKGGSPEKARIPIRVLGRKFENGRPQKEPGSNFKFAIQSGDINKSYYRKEPSGGQLLAAFGSAFSPTLGEVANLDAKAKIALMAVGKVGSVLLSKMLGGKSDEWEQGYDKWLMQTNLAKGLHLYDFANGGNKQVELRDGGIFYNLPLVPLFDPQRKIDIIVVNDASGDLHNALGGELSKFRTYAKDNAYATSRLPHDLVDETLFRSKLDMIAKGKSFAVFNDPRDANFNRDQITIIYAPTYHEGRLKQKPSLEYSTFKLQYSEAESNALIDYNIALARSVSADMKQIIRARAEKAGQ